MCYQKVEGKIVFQDGKVYMLKRCPVHGHERVLMADDVDYYRRCREIFIKPPEMPVAFNTPVRWGCPYDCGLCADHQQHSCLSLIEVADHCNLACPICYADSSPSRQQYRTVDRIQRMIDAGQLPHLNDPSRLPPPPSLTVSEATIACGDVTKTSH